MDSQKGTSRLLRLATYASVATALILIGVKATAWFMTGSLSILGTLVDSLMDVAASVINLFAVRYSLKSADDEHQFGHGKAESLAALAQASFITGSAFFLMIQAIERLNSPKTVNSVEAGVVVMVFSMAATVILVLFQYYVIRKTASTAIRADALHYVTDLLTNASTIVALIFISFGWQIVDPLFAMVIALYILYSAWQIAGDAIQMLMDRELSDEIRMQIRSLAQGHAEVIGVHGLRTRQSGQTKIIQLHLELDDAISLSEAHAIAKEVEETLERKFPFADILIHQDPSDYVKKKASESV